MFLSVISGSRSGKRSGRARHSSARPMIRRVMGIAGWLVFAALQTGNSCPGADDPKTEDRDQRSKRRMEYMQSVINGMQVSSKEIPEETSLKLGRAPVLRYNDPTRSLGAATTGLQDAGVWRLGETGRP